MESRLAPGLHLAGEILDVDGVGGGERRCEVVRRPRGVPQMNAARMTVTRAILQFVEAMFRSSG